MDNYINFLDLYLDDILAVLSILFCGAVVCAIIAIPFYFFKKKQKLHLWLHQYGHTAQGQVVLLYTRLNRMRGDENTPTMISEAHYARYSFKTPQGQTYTGDFPQKRKKMYAVGDAVEVFYNPKNPQQNCTPRQLEEDAATRWIFIILFGVVIAVVLVFAFLFFL